MKTIFDDPDMYGANHQRRLGFWYCHDINPAAVLARSTQVEPIGEDRVRVSYDAVILGPGEVDWNPHLPAGIECTHGGEPHRATERRSVETSRDQIEAIAPSTVINVTSTVDAAAAVSRAMGGMVR